MSAGGNYAAGPAAAGLAAAGPAAAGPVFSSYPPPSHTFPSQIAQVEGVATKWLQRIDTENVRVPMFVRYSQFRYAFPWCQRGRRALTCRRGLFFSAAAPPFQAAAEDQVARHYDWPWHWTGPVSRLYPGARCAKGRRCVSAVEKSVGLSQAAVVPPLPASRCCSSFTLPSACSTGKDVGPTVLFFGCQKEQQHFMYREEMQAYQNEGVLTHLFTAFSRDQVRSGSALRRGGGRGRGGLETRCSPPAPCPPLVPGGKGLRAAPSAGAEGAGVEAAQGRRVHLRLRVRHGAVVCVLCWRRHPCQHHGSHGSVAVSQ